MIAGHVRPDGDCVGSCSALYCYIRDNYPGKHVDVRLEHVPDSYRFISASSYISTDYTEEKEYDLFISVDVSNKERLGKALKYFGSAGKTVCIDHHISNEGFADVNLVVPEASSACEVLAGVMDMDKISREAAEALYMGIICDTGVFSYSCTSRQTMEIAGKLMEKGIPYTDIIENVFYEKTLLQQRLLGKCLLSAKMSLGGQMIAYYITREEMDSWGARNEDLEGIVSQMRQTRGVEVSVLASEDPEGSIKFSLRSKSYVNVNLIAGCFGGGGHERAAGFTVFEDPYKVFSEVEKLTAEQILRRVQERTGND